MNLFPNKESGSISTLTVLGIVGICMMFMYQLNRRSQNEFSYQLHSDIVSHRKAVERKIQDLGMCEKLPQNCKLGDRYNLESRLGGFITRDDGSIPISTLNVLLRCEMFKKKNKTVEKAIVVNVARLDKAGNKLSDPLTPSLPGEWVPLESSFADICNGSTGEMPVVKETTCYGGLNEGIGQLGYELPLDIKLVYCNDAGCRKDKSYCSESLINKPFPDCDPGYRSTFQYLDRYGWAGVDYSKYTVCEKVTP